MDQEQSAALIVMFSILKRKKRLQKRKCWVRQWVQRRNSMGACSTLINEMQIEDPQQFRNFVRMSAEQLEVLINLIGPQIAKKDTRMRNAIPVKHRLLMTLRFLASGDSYNSLQYLFRIPVCTIGRIVKEVTVAIYEKLKTTYLKFPTDTQEWLSYAEAFNQQWNFPHCLGALDGKHIVIQAPPHSGSLYFNYKNSHSIVLLAIADANYRFVYIDVGCNGRVSDGGVFQNCSLYKALEQQRIQLPVPESLSGRTVHVPYFFVADDAFAMKAYILKPYPFRDQPAPNRIFNYRLSRARRVIENAFGIIANRFRILRKPIALHPDKVSNIVLSICALHNFLISTKIWQSQYFYHGSIDFEDPNSHTITPGDWREESEPANTFFALHRGNRHTFAISQKDVRN